MVAYESGSISARTQFECGSRLRRRSNVAHNGQKLWSGASGTDSDQRSVELSEKLAVRGELPLTSSDQT